MTNVHPSQLQDLVSSLHDKETSTPWKAPISFEVQQIIIDDTVINDSIHLEPDIFNVNTISFPGWKTIQVHFCYEKYPSNGGSFGTGFQKLLADIVTVCNNHGFLLTSTGSTKKTLNNRRLKCKCGIVHKKQKNKENHHPTDYRPSSFVND